MIKPTKRTVHLASVREETSDVRTFTFVESSKHEPGQFVNIAFSDDDSLGRRSFSIASAPDEPLELTVKLVGTFTKALFDAPIGTVFEVHGPLGLPYVRFADEPHLLIAGGSGIAPFRSLMRDPKYTNTIFTLIDSNRTYDDIIYRDEMITWKATIIHTLTREERDGYVHGRIDHEMLGRIPNLLTHRVLICGPTGMVSACIENLIALGVAMNRIKTESWGN
jgi:NAD(P)H-flavin reductase